MWQIELYEVETKIWKRFGSPMSDFGKAYETMKKLEEVGHRVRLRKVVR